MITRTRWLRLLAVLLAAGLIAAACGDSDDDDGADDGGDTETTEAVETGEDEDEDTAPATTEPATGEDVTDEESQYGGVLRYGIEAETNTGWTPRSSNCAIACHQIMRAMFDPLTTVTADGEVVPMLAQAVEPVLEPEVEGQVPYGAWDIVLRDEEILFHNGDPLTAEAVAANLLSHTVPTATTFTAAILVNSVEVLDERTVRVYLSLPGGEPGTFPVVALDAGLSGQLGYIVHPDQIEASDGAQNPIGTGAFAFDSWTPNERMSLVRNESYWRSDPDGNQLPYLDGIEYLPLPDVQARTAALEAGQVDIIHTSNGVTINQLTDGGEFDISVSNQFGETSYFMINNNPTLLDGSPNPMADVRVRRGMAHCIDYETLVALRTDGVNEIANGPFPPGSIGHLDDTGYPTFDAEVGRALIEEYEAENGELPTLEFGTTADPFNLGTNELVAEMWNQNCGVEIEIVQIEQGQYITEALLGNFTVFGWRQHSGVDPDQQFVWWHSSSASELGSIGINFGRIRDDVIDTQLEIIRTVPDPAARQAAAEELNRRFGSEVFNFWGWWTVWAHVRDPKVQNLTADFTPEGEPLVPTGVGIGGTHSLAQIFIVG